MLRRKKSKLEPEVSAGSMADIAFLLLIFFLVATTLQKDKGLTIQLPPDVPPTDTPIKERNLFKVLINSNNQFLIEDENWSDLEGLTAEIKAFILNPDDSEKLAETPKKAIISIKTQRGTNYGSFIEILDRTKEAYYQIYGERIGMTSDEFRALNLNNPFEEQLYAVAREGLPMNVSIADTE